ncbi:hypothetical protein NN561_001578 [Cricetulus griseus]
MGEPRRAYLGQPSAAPPPAPEQPPRSWTQLSDVKRALRAGPVSGPAPARLAGLFAPPVRRSGSNSCVSSEVDYDHRLIKEQAQYASYLKY